jgi:hypothetical protein
MEMKAPSGAAPAQRRSHRCKTLANLNLRNAGFNGPDYDPDRDDERLTSQSIRIFDLMKDGQWRTLRQIASMTGDPESSVSAQLRHLRKPRFGGHAVNRRHIKNGLNQYQLLRRKS